MSYARKQPGVSDVYVYSSGDEYVCCHCRLEPDPSFFTAGEVLTHLREHIEAGDLVPDSCVERLKNDLQDE